MGPGNVDGPSTGGGPEPRALQWDTIGFCQQHSHCTSAVNIFVPMAQLLLN